MIWQAKHSVSIFQRFRKNVANIYLNIEKHLLHLI